MSHVYRSVDTILGRTVALKILTESGAADPEAKARFLQEARLASNFSHENIIRVYDFGEEAGLPFIVMEYLRGQSLRDAMKNGTVGDMSAKLSVALQVARALEYIHQRKIIHRDIKPENIQLEHGRVKLMDFGIAKAEGMHLTRAGFTLGTPYYMAPEQVMGQPLTPAADVYSFGILLYELMSGVKPITGETVDRIFDQILHQPLNLDALRAAGAPAPVFDLVVRCTAKKPVGRPQTFGEVARMIEAILSGSPQGRIPTPQPMRVPPAAPAQPRTRLYSEPEPVSQASAKPARFYSQGWLMLFGAAIVICVLGILLAVLHIAGVL